MIVLSGLPGCGKTTWARALVAARGSGLIVSADDYFVGPDGQYRYIASDVLRAHNACFRRFCVALQQRVPLIVVDNTNTTVKEIERYLNEALASGYASRVVRINADPAVCFERQIHDVPPEHFKKVVQRFNQRHVRPEWQVEEITWTAAAM